MEREKKRERKKERERKSERAKKQRKQRKYGSNIASEIFDCRYEGGLVR